VEALHIDPDGPAAKSGLKNGDMLLKINGAATAPRPDPKDAKLTVVDFEFLGILEPPTTLREIKDSGLFPDWALVRQSRLSTMSVPPAFVEWMRKRYGKTKI
jgi:predicted RNA-binding protein with PUA-like domain